MFHPELAAQMEAPFQTVLQEARSLQPPVWITRLRDVSEWWQEREKFNVDIRVRQGGYTLQFLCTPRATLLYRGLHYCLIVVLGVPALLYFEFVDTKLKP